MTACERVLRVVVNDTISSSPTTSKPWRSEASAASEA